MPLVHLPTAASFVSEYDEELTAVLSIAVALALVFVVDRAVRRRGRQIREALSIGDLDPTVDTRLRFVRRFIEAVILVIGVAVALSQFTALDKLAASILASGAIAAAIVGFAARQTLANVVAGVMLAITQPLRIGDHVTVEGESGVVEDVRLTYTYLHTGADARLIVPNERLASSILRNDTIVSPSVATEVDLWLPAGADADRAIATVAEVAGETTVVRLAEMDADGRVRLQVRGTAGRPDERIEREAELRQACLRRLRAAGLLEGPAPAAAGG